MTAEVLAFRDPQADGDREALKAALVELHTLITLDPIMGASPVRIYFVLNPVAKARIAECGGVAARTRPAAAYALIAYDFPFALHLVETSARQVPPERARAIVTGAADLQGALLHKAAACLDVEALSIPDFDAVALKESFFPNTQETVTGVFRLELRRP